MQFIRVWTLLKSLLNEYIYLSQGASLATQTVKNPPAVQESWVQSLCQDDTLEKEMATHQYSCLENPRDRGAWQATVHRIAKK